MFGASLRTKILNGELRTDLDVYLFTFSEGFQIKDANSILKDLNGKEKINLDFKLTSSNIHRIKIASEIKLK